MPQPEHGRAWRVAEYVGLVSDKPKPSVGSGAWWLNFVLLGALVAIGFTVATVLGLL